MGAPDIDAAKRGDLAMYTTREAAAFLRMSPASIRRLVMSCLLKPDMMSGKGRKSHLFTLDTLKTFVVNQSGPKR